MWGGQCIPVWHKSRGIQEFKNLCSEYEYIAIGGFAIKDIKPKEYQYIYKMIEYAKSKNVKVHGLGFTKVNEIPKGSFFSVDSTRWNCTRFGRIEYYDGKTIKAIDKRNIGKRIKTEKRNEINRIIFGEWVKFQKYADKYL